MVKEISSKHKVKSLDEVNDFLKNLAPKWGHGVEAEAVFRLDDFSKPLWIKHLKRKDTYYVCFAGEFFQIKKQDGSLIELPQTRKHSIELPSQACYPEVKALYDELHLSYTKPLKMCVRRINTRNYEVTIPMYKVGRETLEARRETLNVRSQLK